MRKYWQAELTTNGASWRDDFPEMATREEAEEDARYGLAGLTESERLGVRAAVVEWCDDGYIATNTGAAVEVQL